MTPSPLLRRLRADTRPHHTAAEVALDLMRADLTVAGYRAVLAKLYGFHRPLEPVLAGAADWCRYGLDLTARLKAPLLAADLMNLGANPASAPDCALLPAVDSPARAFGCLYVLEGATLGGRVVGPHVGRLLGVSAGHGGRYFAGYGPLTGASWAAFCSALDAFAGSDEPTHDAVVAAAGDTFSALTRWVSC